MTDATRMEEIRARAERLRAFARDHKPGSCRVLSQGEACECPLCDVDVLLAELQRLTARLAEVEGERDEYRKGAEVEAHAGDEARQQAAQLTEYKQLYNHAQNYVDQLFQKCESIPNPLLPDFIRLGEDKFRAVIRLAHAYIEATQQSAAMAEELKQRDATIAALRNELEKDSACWNNEAMNAEHFVGPHQAEQYRKWSKESEAAAKSTTIGQELLDRLAKQDDEIIDLAEERDVARRERDEAKQAANAWNALMNGIEAIREAATDPDFTPDQCLNAYIEVYTRLKKERDTYKDAFNYRDDLLDRLEDEAAKLTPYPEGFRPNAWEALCELPGEYAKVKQQLAAANAELQKVDDLTLLVKVAEDDGVNFHPPIGGLPGTIEIRDWCADNCDWSEFPCEYATDDAGWSVPVITDEIRKALRVALISKHFPTPTPAPQEGE